MLKKRKLSYLQVQLLAWLPLTWGGRAPYNCWVGVQAPIGPTPYPPCWLEGHRVALWPACGLRSQYAERALFAIWWGGDPGCPLGLRGHRPGWGYGVVVVVGVPRYSLLRVEV